MLNCRHKIIVYVSCIKFWDRVCIEIHDTGYTKHDVFVYRVPNSDA